MKQVIEEDVEFRESNNYNFPTPIPLHTSMGRSFIVEKI